MQRCQLLGSCNILEVFGAAPMVFDSCGLRAAWFAHVKLLLLIIIVLMFWISVLGSLSDFLGRHTVFCTCSFLSAIFSCICSFCVFCICSFSLRLDFLMNHLPTLFLHLQFCVFPARAGFFPACAVSCTCSFCWYFSGTCSFLVPATGKVSSLRILAAARRQELKAPSRQDHAKADCDTLHPPR